MNPKPTKNEILEKYRHVIDVDDFEILYEQSLPTPEETHQDNASLQYLGTLGGWCVWAKRQFGRVVAVILFIGTFVGGIEAINKYGRLGYDQIAQYVQRGSEHCETPATEYVVFDKPNDWALPPDQPIRLTTTTTTTTTTAPPEDPNITTELPPGSGLAPNSAQWHA